MDWYKYQTIKEDLIPWIGWQTLGTPASFWQKNNGLLCSKTWINSKPFFILLQCSVNERTKRLVRLWWECWFFFISNADLSIVENTVNSKCCVSRTFSCICVRVTFCRLPQAGICELCWAWLQCVYTACVRRDGLFRISRLWGKSTIL